ncbi:hypothetical protein [Phenylobacterium zucineum]|uniref:hypothetical protein n=1 Tax=Phenylobacterium zucineum TaxID=284016 RepID=UPI00031D90EA|nr:hypothetical protein [Phenylobacterium zucineum]
MLRFAPALLPLAALAACATAIEGDRPSALYGQSADAAVALYGPWDEAVTLAGKRYHIWRRRADTADGPRYCELRLEITPQGPTGQGLIARRLVQGYPEACDLFTAQMVPVERK